ncbi:hypothetical protein [Shewanella sp. NIFS-20-20]|uniref:hypothetical protein n=1 Tax=Shewanella sp. NIFS-20-20 TaxID=2853806 RepID=UPI001C447DBE|nr:hypothetical protein [Shewanella sp. NIFS-20-20]MBV7316505.1 hypothetical protein [Shewanella sp. NIFS-20-20]
MTLVTRWTQQALKWCKFDFWQDLNHALMARWQALSGAGQSYFIAIALLLLGWVGWAALLIVIGLIIESWPIFTRMWHSLGGKAIILLFYAIIANFALAHTAAVVNEVVGVSAAYLDYTHNFALLLYLPGWFVFISLLALLALAIIAPCYMVIVFLLRHLGMFNRLEFVHKKFAIRKALLRAFLALVLLYEVSDVINFERAMGLDSEFDLGNTVNDNHDAAPLLSKATEALGVTTAATIPDTVADSQADTAAIIASKSESASQLDTTPVSPSSIATPVSADNDDYIDDDYHQLIREWLAWFSYAYDADSRSRCTKSEQTNVVDLNAFEILTITPDSQAQYGYRYGVEVCHSPAFPLAVTVQ